MGDFNCILDSTKRSEGASLSQVGCRWFQDFLFENALWDLGSSGAQLTWYRGGLSQRLDKAIGNLDLMLSALDCSVHNLHRLKSDHRPILVSLKPKSSRGDRPF